MIAHKVKSLQLDGPEARGGPSGAASPLPHMRTSQRKVRNSVRVGPPDLIKLRIFTLRVKLAV